MLIFTFAIGFGLSAQVNQVDNRNRKQGTWIKYYENATYSSQIRYKGQFKDDKPIGKFVYYYTDGKVMAIINHEEKTERSEAFYYHPTEKIAAHGIFRNQLKDSIWDQFLPTGEYSYKEQYKNGKLNGEKITYYGPEVSKDKRNPIVLRRLMYKNDVLDGTFEEYFPNGTIKTKGNYVNGSLSGTITRNHPNGKKMIIERWKNKQRHGWWVTYDESGNEQGRTYFKEGVELEGEKLDKYLKELKEKGINPNQ